MLIVKCELIEEQITVDEVVARTYGLRFYNADCKQANIKIFHDINAEKSLLLQFIDRINNTDLDAIHIDCLLYTSDAADE